MTGIIFKVDCTRMTELLFLEFYVERENAVVIEREDLIRVFLDDDVLYYATVDASRLGRGRVMCRAHFADKERMYPNNVRPVVVSGFTGCAIPCMGMGGSIACGDYVVTLTKVQDIPKGDAVIYYGIGDLDAPDLRKLNGTKETEAVDFSFSAGDEIVVVIPYDWDEVATKDGGMGSEMGFSTAVKGRNGEVMVIDDVKYKVYGELMIVPGKMKVYIR